MISAVATTLASIAVTVLSGIIKDDYSCLPFSLQNALFRRYNACQRAQCQRAKAVLDRLILSLADQQLATGIALLVAGGIKAAEAADVGSIDDFLDGPHAVLIIYLCCLSSTTHLAAIINLKAYFLEHYRLGFVRIALVAAFGVVLATALCFSRPDFFLPINQVSGYNLGEAISRDRNVGYYLLIAFFFVIYTFWLAAIQLVGGRESRFAQWIHDPFWPTIKRWFRLETALTRARKWNWYPKASRVIKATFWFLVVGHPFAVCLFQLGFATITLICALLRKFAPAWSTWLTQGDCDLTGPEENSWGFGQILPMVLLVLPIWQAAEIASGQHMRNCTKSA